MSLTYGLGMLHLILFQPDIPQNTGSIGRTCAITGSRLHLIHPLGFEISDRHLKRSGMDYWHSLDVHEHADWQAFIKSPLRPQRLWLFTTHGSRSFWDAKFADGDGLIFGKETAGAPEWLHAQMAEGARLKVDQPQAGLRSLNQATCAGIAVYEALRQLR
jgi:tRNA (cytidine/uridine-2'-O-)-methyltransferase